MKILKEVLQILMTASIIFMVIAGGIKLVTSIFKDVKKLQS